MLYPQDLVRDNAVTATDVGVWCYTAIEVFGPWKEGSLVSAAQISYQIYGTEQVNRNRITDITYSLQHLLQLGYLHGERIGKQHYYIKMDSFDAEQWKNYKNVDVQDIRKIFNQHKRPFSILRMYLFLLSTIDPKTKVGTWRNDTIAETLDQEVETVTRYYKAMEKLELLYIYRGMYTSNTYGRFGDKEEVIKVGKQRSGGRTLHLSSNMKRKYTQLYNQVKAGNPKYLQDPELLADICTACSALNDQAEQPIYDLSVFELDFSA